MPIEKKNFIQKGMDLDHEDRFVQGHRFALNVNLGTSDGNNKGAVENSLGNRLISFDLPGGVLTVIGTYSDRVNSSVIYMVHNTSQDHLVLRFFIKDEIIEELARGSELEFQQDVLISSMDLDDDLFVWTEGVTPQRKINIVKASINKNLVVKLYFELLPPISTDYTLSIPELSVVSIVHTVPGPNPDTLEELTENVTEGINLLPLAGTDFEAIDAGTHVELRMLNTGYFTVSFTANTSNPIAVYDNMYQKPLLSSYIDYLKAPPRFLPVANFIADDTYKDVNDIEHKAFEFRTRYIFDDGELSALSPASKLPVNPDGYPFSEDNDSYIEVDYLDEKLSNPSELNIITGVDLFVREENIGLWEKVKTILIDEIVGTNGKFVFLNNEKYAPISTFESDQLYDALPVLSEAIGFMDKLAFLDAKVEGYDAVTTNVKMTLEVKEEVIFTSQADRGSFLKRPGFYKWGLVYYDRGNRSTTVCKDPAMELSIPAYDADLSTISYVEVPPPTVPPDPPVPDKRYGVVSLNWEIRHLPPVWATHYSWVRTLDSIHNEYLQTTIQGTVTYYKDDRTTTTTFNNADVAYVKLIFAGWPKFNDKYSEGTQGWVFAPGDKIRILKDDFNIFLTDILVLTISEKVDGETFIVEVDSTMPQIKTVSLVEFFSPGKTVENEVYYETGQFFEIKNPHTASRSHKGEFLDQNPSTPITTPAKGTFKDGDNYRIVGRDWTIGPDRIIDSPRADQRFKERLESYNSGRVNVYVPNFKQSHRTSTVRFSDRRFQGTNINGYSTFDDLNQYDLSVDYGPIQLLTRIDNIMLCVCTREVISLYINENIYIDVKGDPTVTVSNDVIGDDRVLKGGFGTENPESFAKHGGRGWWWSSNKGHYVRYGGDGITSLSNIKASTYFKDKSVLINKHGGKIISTFDEFHDKVIVAISEIKDGINVIEVAETIVFHEGDESSLLEKSWVEFVSYLPEHMAMVDTKVVHFKNGELWIHDNPVRCNYFGVQYTSQIEAVFNESPDMVKVFKNISMQSNDLWTPISITTPEGQQSSLQAGDIDKKENIYYSDILMDENTPNVDNPITQGDAMRSVVLKVLLENSNTDKSVLYFVAVGFKESFSNLR